MLVHPLHPLGHLGQRLGEGGQLRVRIEGEVLVVGRLAERLIADLSQFDRSQPGDLNFTGTREGVDAVRPGDRIDGAIAGVGEISPTIGPAV